MSRLYAKLSTEEAVRRFGYCRPPTSLEVRVSGDGDVEITTRGKALFGSSYDVWLDKLRKLARERPDEVCLVEGGDAWDEMLATGDPGDCGRGGAE